MQAAGTLLPAREYQFEVLFGNAAVTKDLLLDVCHFLNRVHFVY